MSSLSNGTLFSNQRIITIQSNVLGNRKALTVNEQPVLLEQTPFPRIPTLTVVQPSP